MNRRSRGCLALLLASLLLVPLLPAPDTQAAALPGPGMPQALISPFAVNALISSEQKVTALDGLADDHFGYSVAISGDTALVGAYNANDSTGAAYVFIRSGAAWIYQATLAAADGRPGDRFGIAVAVSGDTALVGADKARIGSQIYQGAAYVFTRGGVSWTQQAELTAGDGAENDRFGSVLALSGNTALVGVPYDQVGDHAMQGSAYIFVRSGTAWSQQAHLIANDGAAADWFGYAVALSGDTALIGAVVDDIGAQTNQGSAYIFTRSGSQWAQSVKLVHMEGVEEDRFGYAVALAGDTCLVSAVNVNSGKSAVFVFTGSGSSWTLQDQWTVAGGNNYDNFGQAVSLAGSTALVAARPTNGGLGSAYLFNRPGAVWLLQAQLFASDGTPNDQFGNSAALSGSWALVGAPNATIGSNLYQGAAYFYQLTMPPNPLIPIYLPLLIN